jgi:hypothetical protein
MHAVRTVEHDTRDDRQIAEQLTQIETELTK